MSVILGVLLSLAALQADPAFEGPRTIDLGGPRKASATITVAGSDYLIRARMLPVTSFDETTNAQINRDRARLLALAALARALSGSKTAELAVSGARVEEQGKDGKFHTLRLRVPRSGVVVLKPGTKSPPHAKTERIAFGGDLFTRKRDHAQTLEQLHGALLADLRRLEAAQQKKPDAEAFALGITDLEEKGTRNLDRLVRLIRNDISLFSHEQDELAQSVARQKKTFLARLKKALEAKEEP